MDESFRATENYTYTNHQLQCRLLKSFNNERGRCCPVIPHWTLTQILLVFDAHTRIRSPSMHTDILLFTAFCATYLLDTYKALSPPNKFCFILSFPCAYVAALPVNYTATQIH